MTGFPLFVADDPALRLGHFLEEQLPEERTAVIVDAHSQVGGGGTTRRSGRHRPCSLFGTRPATLVTMHHHEVDAHRLEPGDHRRAMFADVVLALRRRGHIPRAAVAADSERQGLPTAGHYDPLLSQPRGALIDRQRQRRGPRQTGDTDTHQQTSYDGHAYHVSRSFSLTLLASPKRGSQGVQCFPHARARREAGALQVRAVPF